jgi:multidrug efflux pump subunit AcrB
MIRHYYLRAGDAVADLQINLVDKGARDSQSHDIARRIRPLVQAAARGTGASVKVVEVPPGPPVLSTLVAEIYAPTEAQRTAIAERVVDRFEAHPSVVDVDWSRSAPQPELAFLVDPDRAARAGVARPAVVEAIEAALGGRIATHLRDPDSREPVPVRVRLTEPVRSGLDRLAGLHVRSGDGSMVPLLELVRVVERTSPQVVDRKNGRPVLYVTAEVAGGQESPVYAMLDLKPELAEIEVSDGPRVGAANGTGVGSAGRVELAQIFAGQPGLVESPVLKWDGEWQITYEVFRDLGIAFAGALLLIYVLIVGWFGSFTTPLLMMAAIPLTLIGIAPGHWAFGAFFTATSMIGLIALAGIMVRNGILLIDYLEVRLAQHVPLKQAVLEAGAVRARPIALTAGTVVIGALVILFDPIFQGLAVSLVTGAVASTILTLVVVPGLYFLAHRRRTTDAEPPRDTRAGDATPRSRPADDAPPTPDAPPVEKPVDAKAALPDVADSAVERPAPDPPVEVPR